MGLGTWLLIGAVIVGGYVLLVPASVKCKIPIIGGGPDACDRVARADKFVNRVAGVDIDTNAPPITQFGKFGDIIRS